MVVFLGPVSLPQTQRGAVQLDEGGGDGVLHQVFLRSHLAVDVPVEAGRGEGVEGGAVGHQGLARLVHRQRPGDHRAVVREV